MCRTPRQHVHLSAALTVALASCSGRPPVEPGIVEPRPTATVRTAPAAGWSDSTRSPWPPVARSPLVDLLAEHCRKEDGALDRVAERAARRLVDGGAPLDDSELVFLLRAEGSPYVWPRSLAFEVGALSAAEIGRRLDAWLGKQPRARTHCGLADETPQGRRVIAAVTADALGDLTALPTRVRPGTWLTFEARLDPGIDAAKVVVLGPRGSPHAVPTSFDGESARASFSLDAAGGWIVQLVASTNSGPRPALEARVFAGVDPPASYALELAPGERDVTSEDPAELARALSTMVAAARMDSRVPALRVDPTLSRVARRHAEAMRAAATTAHDVGDADPATRVAASGLVAKAAGENVAHGKTLGRAHRAIWQSPSHRGNLLDTRYDSLGVGVAVDPDGSVWICEVFAALG